MKKVFLIAGFCLLGSIAFTQTITDKLQKAFQQFEADSQLKHAISSLYVIDAATGEVMFDKNSQVGLAPASTQKIITSVTAFELLGKDYRYKTEVHSLGYKTYIVGYGDPTLGSWRFNKDADKVFFSSVIEGLKNKGIKHINQLITTDYYFKETIPSGWIFEDIANYYGASASSINWHENQYDLVFIPGKKVGDIAEIDTFQTPVWIHKRMRNECKTGPKGSGDNAYIYIDEGFYDRVVKGTVPLGPERFTISGAIHEPESWLSLAFMKYCDSLGVHYSNEDDVISQKSPTLFKDHKPEYTYYSPSLDSIIYWFLKKSINLYGEALIKTFAYEKQGFGSTDSGVAILKKFWKEKGLDEDELNMADGSGLSPLNRVTTHAQVEILKYAKAKDWFPYFYDALPEYNAMKMKSGTISDVKGFCGYHKAKDGKEYIFSFLVNNYNGRSSQLVNKMYKVLDELK